MRNLYIKPETVVYEIEPQFMMEGSGVGMGVYDDGTILNQQGSKKNDFSFDVWGDDE